MEVNDRKKYISFNRDLHILKGDFTMIEIYLEELANACEAIEELRSFKENYHAKAAIEERRNYCEEMIEKITEWIEM